MHQELLENIKRTFYRADLGVWFDFNMETMKHNTNFYPSNFFPLFTMCYKRDQTDLNKILSYLDVNLIVFS